ncbi:hypothetical protein GF352_03035 [archaeon]|nr:hypothetical protein [archaeon]
MTPHEAYVKHYDKFQSDYKTDLTTIYDIIVSNMNGMSAMEITLYPKTIPDIEQLNGGFEEWFHKLSDLKSSFLTAINNFSKEVEGAGVKKIESGNGRVTKIHQLSNGYFVIMSHDINKHNYVELEAFIEKIYFNIEDLMDNYQTELEAFQKEGGSLEGFKSLDLKIRKLANIGFNNQEALEKFNKLTKELELYVKKLTTPSFIKQNKVTREDIVKGYTMLKNLKIAFPFYDSELLKFLKSKVESRDKPEELLKQYSNIMKQDDIDGLIKELDNPLVRDYLNVDNLVKKLEDAKGKEMMTRMALIEVKEFVKSSINPSLIKHKTNEKLNKLTEEMKGWLKGKRKVMRAELKAKFKKEASQKPIIKEPEGKKPETLDSFKDETINWLRKGFGTKKRL